MLLFTLSPSPSEGTLRYYLKGLILVDLKNFRSTLELPSVLSRYQFLFAVGGFFYPIWGVFLTLAIPQCDVAWMPRLVISGLALIVLLASVFVPVVSDHIASLFVFFASLMTIHALYTINTNHSHIAFILIYQVLVFSIATSIEKLPILISYTLAASAGLFLVQNDAGALPKAFLLASTLTMGLVAIINLIDRIGRVKALEDRDKYINAITRSIPGFFAWVTRDLVYIEVNQAVADAVNLSVDDFPGNPIGFMGVEKSKELSNLVKDTFASESVTLTREIHLMLLRRPAVFIMSCTKYLHNQEAVLVGIDVTASKHQESLIKVQQMQLLHSAKFSALGEMSAGIAHEINNPLTVIAGFAAQIKRSLGSESIDRDVISVQLSRIVAMSDRIAKTVRGLRNFSRDSSADPMIVTTLRQLVDDTVELCNERFKSFGVDLRIGPDLSNISLSCQPTQMSQVLLNLLNNSCDAVFELQDRWIAVDAKMSGNWVEIYVTDSGPGISRLVADKIMEPFFTTKLVGQGTGLGLSISKGIIQDHGGVLSYVEDYPNTRFMINIPMAQIKI